MHIFLRSYRLVDVIQYPFGGLVRLPDRERLALVLRGAAHGKVIQVVEQQRILGQPLQRGRQQIL